MLKYLILLFILGIMAIAAYPQQFYPFGVQQNNGQPRQQFTFPSQRPSSSNGQNLNVGSSSTTSTSRPSATQAAISTTTPSPQYLACLQSCPTTSEYNPICGSDNINYHNTGRLDCAVRCGQNVVAVRSGVCQPL